MSQETETETRKVFSLGDQIFFVDSLSEEQKKALVQIDQINNKIEGKNVEIRDLQYASQYLIMFIKADENGLEEYIEPEAQSE